MFAFVPNLIVALVKGKKLRLERGFFPPNVDVRVFPEDPSLRLGRLKPGSPNSYWYAFITARAEIPIERATSPSPSQAQHLLVDGLVENRGLKCMAYPAPIFEIGAVSVV